MGTWTIDLMPENPRRLASGQIDPDQIVENALVVTVDRERWHDDEAQRREILAAVADTGIDPRRVEAYGRV